MSGRAGMQAAYGAVYADELPTAKKLEPYLCDDALALDRNRRSKAIRRWACEGCECPCAFGLRYLELSARTEEEKTLAKEVRRRIYR